MLDVVAGAMPGSLVAENGGPAGVAMPVGAPGFAALLAAAGAGPGSLATGGGADAAEPLAVVPTPGGVIPGLSLVSEPTALPVVAPVIPGRAPAPVGVVGVFPGVPNSPPVKADAGEDGSALGRPVPRREAGVDLGARDVLGDGRPMPGTVPFVADVVAGAAGAPGAAPALRRLPPALDLGPPVAERRAGLSEVSSGMRRQSWPERDEGVPLAVVAAPAPDPMVHLVSMPLRAAGLTRSSMGVELRSQGVGRDAMAAVAAADVFAGLVGPAPVLAVPVAGTGDGAGGGQPVMQGGGMTVAGVVPIAHGPAAMPAEAMGLSVGFDAPAPGGLSVGRVIEEGVKSNVVVTAAATGADRPEVRELGPRIRGSDNFLKPGVDVRDGRGLVIAGADVARALRAGPDEITSAMTLATAAAMPGEARLPVAGGEAPAPQALGQAALLLGNDARSPASGTALPMADASAGQPPAPAIASERLGAVRIGVEGGAQDLRVSLAVGMGAGLVVAEAPRLVADLAAQGVRVQSLDISGAGAGMADSGGDPRPRGSPLAPGLPPAGNNYGLPTRADLPTTYADRYA